ncbi:hypothetical protein TWF481_010994 [Arthrobotrys musiformis]|uniref:Uncharacterized protein n=1 Tax=Arthrobotrys musiformis TaxID=47236 RepID=A0AAV9VYY6_9PEZI
MDVHSNMQTEVASRATAETHTFRTPIFAHGAFMTAAQPFVGLGPRLQRGTTSVLARAASTPPGSLEAPQKKDAK